MDRERGKANHNQSKGKLNPGDQAQPGTPGVGENICPDCGGTGHIGARPCKKCGGTGRIMEGIGGG